MDKCVHVQEALRRHGSPGSLLLIVLALIIFSPRIWDTVRGEPALTNVLTIVTKSDGQVVVQDLTQTRSPVHGVRAAVIEAEDGSVICSTEHHNTWTGERNRFWRISAFTGCPVPDRPYRICSGFAVESASGRQRYLGPFCSPFAVPGG